MTSRMIEFLRTSKPAARVRRVPEWLTPAEAAAYLKVTRSTIYRYMDLGLLPFHELRTGGGRRLMREDLDALLQPGDPTRRDGHDGKQGT